jgi:hypothetical protein
MSRCRELGAEVTTHGARPYYRDTHDVEVAIALTLIAGRAEVNLTLGLRFIGQYGMNSPDGKNRSARRSRGVKKL